MIAELTITMLAVISFGILLFCGTSANTCAIVLAMWLFYSVYYYVQFSLMILVPGKLYKDKETEEEVKVLDIYYGSVVYMYKDDPQLYHIGINDFRRIFKYA